MSKRYLKLLSLACISASMSPSQADAAAFNGSYVGVSTGWMHKKVDTKIKTYGILKDKHTFNNLPLIVHLGYVSSAPNSFLWAVEAGLGYTFMNKKSKIWEGDKIIDGDRVAGKIELELKSKLYAEFATKLGWNFDDQYAAYGIFGLSYQKVEIKVMSALTPAEANKLAQGARKDNVVGIFPGIGGAIKLTDNWVARGEYKYHFQTTPKLVKEGSKAKIGTHDIRIALDYAF